jgi:hypothetical protein
LTQITLYGKVTSIARAMEAFYALRMRSSRDVFTTPT